MDYLQGAGHPIKLFVPTKSSKTYLPTEENELIIGFEVLLFIYLLIIDALSMNMYFDSLSEVVFF